MGAGRELKAKDMPAPACGRLKEGLQGFSSFFRKEIGGRNSGKGEETSQEDGTS